MSTPSSSSPEAQSPSTPGSPPNDLKHTLSQGGLTTHSRDTVKERVSSRASNRLSTITARGVGSRSPNSIPSSPTSVHSSSSAIFERDIEPLISSSPPYSREGPHPNPHRIPRSKGTEHLEQSVPSVLDSAAAILTTSLSAAEEDQIAVITPACGPSSGIASPIGSFRSRSPSPSGGMSPTGKNHRASLLLSIPAQGQTVTLPMTTTGTSSAPAPPSFTSQGSAPQQSPGSAGAVPRPMIKTNVSNTNTATPSIVTPTSAYYSLASNDSSPTTTTMEHPPQPLPLPAENATTGSPSSFARTIPPRSNSAGLSHPPSPTNNAAKRLSFMSYSDLLTSTPASTLPLSSHTTSLANNEPPPHIPSVSGLTQLQAQNTIQSSNASVYGMQVKEGDAPEDVGGEWTREGLGRGLEERLEALMGVDIRASA